jgi:uncharacterized protein with ParB-like and HNH nuclease domain
MPELQTLRTQYRVSDFLTWKRDGALDLNPDFQRRSVWKKGAKSFLIDTILKGFPMPIIFLRDLPSDLKKLKSRRDVVDGQQRLRTIFSFMRHFFCVQSQVLKFFCKTCLSRFWTERRLTSPVVSGFL